MCMSSKSYKYTKQFIRAQNSRMNMKWFHTSRIPIKMRFFELHQKRMGFFRIGSHNGDLRITKSQFSLD